MLVIPLELSGLDVDRHSRVTVEFRRRLARHGVDIAVALPPGPRFGIGDAPIEQFSIRVVGTGKAPGASDPFFGWNLAPRVAAGLTFRRRVIELPEFFSGFRVMRRKEAVG